MSERAIRVHLPHSDDFRAASTTLGLHIRVMAQLRGDEPHAARPWLQTGQSAREKRHAICGIM